MLLKSLLKEEENINTMFVPVDQKDAYNASLYFIDYLTWPEVLRAYVQSSPDFSPVLAIVEEDSYPCVEVSKKIKVSLNGNFFVYFFSLFCSCIC